MSDFRIGIGFDIHRTDPDRPLVLGGVVIPEAPFGLFGHSDADVLLHAVADACLGAAGLGDIGGHFPDSDPNWQDADSADLLRRVVEILAEGGWSVSNVDVTVIAEEPRLAGYIAEMRERLAELLNCPPAAASIKATTHEGMDALGRSEGIAAHAVVLIAAEPEEAH
jgi:2-C-methyl-D-erythritol 2,4-cyclodiphosphate synthase